MTYCDRLQSMVLALVISLGVTTATAQTASEFPFGYEMTLEANPVPGTKRIPVIEIGGAGETQVDLWCSSGKGQFSVAGDTLIFLAGSMQQRNCTPELAKRDEDLITAMGAVTHWKRQRDVVTFSGGTTLKFRINTN